MAMPRTPAAVTLFGDNCAFAKRRDGFDG